MCVVNMGWASDYEFNQIVATLVSRRESTKLYTTSVGRHSPGFYHFLCLAVHVILSFSALFSLHCFLFLFNNIANEGRM